MFKHKQMTSMVTVRFITVDTKNINETKNLQKRETREMILFLNASSPTPFTKFVDFLSVFEVIFLFLIAMD